MNATPVDVSELLLDCGTAADAACCCCEDRRLESRAKGLVLAPPLPSEDDALALASEPFDGGGAALANAVDWRCPICVLDLVRTTKVARRRPAAMVLECIGPQREFSRILNRFSLVNG